MVEIKVLNRLLHRSQQECEQPIVHREELRKIHASICLKMRKAMVQLGKQVKGAKQWKTLNNLFQGFFEIIFLGLFCCYFVV